MQPGRGPNQIRHNFIIFIVASPRFFADINFRHHCYVHIDFFYRCCNMVICLNVAEKKNWEGQKTQNFLPFLLLFKWLLETVQSWHFFLPVYSVFVIILILFIDSFWARKDRRFCWQNYWDIITFQDLSFLLYFYLNPAFSPIAFFFINVPPVLLAGIYFLQKVCNLPWIVCRL